MVWLYVKRDPNYIWQLIPLVVLFLFLAVFAFVGYHIYVSINLIKEKATEDIGKKNITFSKEGVRVGVKEIDTEKYVDATQKVFVSIWNNYSETTAAQARKKFWSWSSD